MFSRKPAPTPRGVPLGDLEEALKLTTLKPSREGDMLVVEHESAVTRVEVLASGFSRIVSTGDAALP
jgi:hypothetical protein